MKYVKLGLILFVLTSFASAEVFYSVEAGSKTLSMDSSVKLDCEPAPEGSGCPVTRWTARLSVPAEAEIQTVKSQNGEVVDYTRNGKTLTVKTETPPTESELIDINYVINRNALEVEDGLYTRSISLPGFSGQKTSGNIEVEDFISGRMSSGFQYSQRDETVNFTGTGAANFVTAFGDGEEKTYFTVFGQDLENSSKAYEISVGTLGISNRFKTFPVAIIDSEKYDESVNEWSAGQYTNATIYLRDDLEKDELPVLAHEAVHGLNEQAFDWEGRSAWFDEGTAKYVEFLVRKSQGDRTRELFGDDVKYNKREDGKIYRYTLPPSGDQDRLWAYYENEESWMKDWRPEQGNREFGYAYGHLVIKNYVKENGSLRQLYRQLSDTDYENNAEKWREMKDYVDVTPCKHDSRERFETCLDELNSYEYPVYTATDIQRAETSVQVEKLEVPEPKQVKPRTVDLGKTGEEAESILQQILDFLKAFLNS